jgi:hypothetical protein
MLAEQPEMDREDDEIDRLIGSLAQPLSVPVRLSILERLVVYWHGPSGPDDGYSDLDLGRNPLPLPLRRWYRYGGRRSGILSHQNSLLGPDELELTADGRLLFYVENQGVYLWCTACRGDDPPVWGRKNKGDEPWVEEEATLSGFLIQVCLFEAVSWAMHSACCGASASWVDQETLDRVTAPLKRVPLGDWRWPAYPNRFYTGKGTFAVICPNGEWRGKPGHTIWVGARTRGPLAYLKGIIGDAWEYTAL